MRTNPIRVEAGPETVECWGGEGHARRVMTTSL